MPQVWLRVAIAGVLFVSLACALLAPPPRRPATTRQIAVITWFGLAFAGAGGSALATGRLVAAMLLVAVSVEWLLFAGWRLRYRSGDDGGEDDGKPLEPRPDDPEGLDWDRFEREFRAYAESQSTRRDAAPR
jgi:hypothetical protein